MGLDFHLQLALGSHLISFTKIDDPNPANDVLESRLNKEFELRSTTDLVTDLETCQRLSSNAAATSANHNVYENMKEALKNVLARRSEIKNDTISVSVRYSHQTAVLPVRRRMKAEIALSGPFLHNIFGEYKWPLMIYLLFTVREPECCVNRPLSIWFFTPEFAPSINQQGECFFVESISTQIRECPTVQEGVEYKAGFSINFCAPRVSCRVDLPAKVLENEIEWDFELIGKTGKRFHCRRGYLAYKSPVLSGMLESNCEEIRGNSYQMDLSDDGVQDLLAFIYQANTTMPMRDSLTLWEMFEVGLKYEVVGLAEAIEAMFLRQTNEWLEVDVAVKLFLHSLKGEGNGQLKWKSIQAMKSKSNELMRCATFDELWKNEPDTAKEIMRLMLMMNAG